MVRPKVSLIIRTFNEERWINPCFKALQNQSFKDFEILVVDNQSTDKTIDKIKSFPVEKILSIKDYLPGKALNIGIKKSKGDYIVFISAHCIPVGNLWLEKLVHSLEEDENYAGVYGRQEPMSFTSSSDKRDLLLVFGLDRKIQSRDSFFHNANSIIRKKCWEEVQFDSTITNIEDRIWAQEMLNRGFKILYEPEASVYHYHGIHQDGNQERLNNVVKIIESQPKHLKKGRINAKNLKIVAIIPVRGKTRTLGDKNQIVYTIDSALKSNFIDRIIVSTDEKYTANISINAGAECPFLRPLSLSESHVNLETIQKFSLNEIESSGYFPDLVVHLEETFPFRDVGLLDGMILHLLEEGYDSVIAARPEAGWIWRETSEGNLERIDSGDVPREFKEKTLIGLHGLGCITHPEYIRKGNLTGIKTGLFEVKHPLAGIEIRNEEAALLASSLL